MTLVGAVQPADGGGGGLATHFACKPVPLHCPPSPHKRTAFSGTSVVPLPQVSDVLIPLMKPPNAAGAHAPPVTPGGAAQTLGGGGGADCLHWAVVPCH